MERKDFGIVCIGRQFPYKERRSVESSKVSSQFLRNLLVEEPPSSWRKKDGKRYGLFLAELNHGSLSLLLRLRRQLFQVANSVKTRLCSRQFCYRQRKWLMKTR